MKTPHTMTARGKRVRVTLLTGETFIDKFLERTPKKVLVFASGRRVRCGDVKSFSDHRLLQPVSKENRVS